MAKPEDVILKEIDRVMNDVIDRVFQLSQENLVRLHTKQFKSGRSMSIITTDTGNLLKTGNVNRKFLDKEIVYSAPYAEDVEFGSSGREVKAEELTKWVRRKVLKGKGSKGKVMFVAKNIARSLRARGQAPDPFLQPAAFQAQSEFKLKI